MNHILSVYTNTTQPTNKTNTNENEFLIDFGVGREEILDKDKEVTHIKVISNFKISYLYSNTAEIGYGYIKDNNNLINEYVAITNLILNVEHYESRVFDVKEIDEIQEQVDKYEKSLKDFIIELFNKTSISPNIFFSFYDNAVLINYKSSNKKSILSNFKINNNPALIKGIIESPFLTELLGLENNVSYIFKNNEIIGNNSNSYNFKGMDINSSINYSTTETQLAKEEYANVFKKNTNFLKLPYELRVKTTEKYKQHLITQGIESFQTKNQLRKYNDSIKLVEHVRINDTLDEYNTEYDKIKDKVKGIIKHQPKPCKKFVKKLKLVKEQAFNKDNQDYKLFKLILQNITRDSKGNLCPLYYNFVLSQIVKFVKQPTILLKPNERGYVMLEGLQNTGKSSFLKLMELLFNNNVYRIPNSKLINIYNGSKEAPLEEFKSARFICMEETLEFTNKNKEILKEFSHENRLTFNVKYQVKASSVDVNYTTFCAYNTKPNAVRGNIFLESDNSNRRFVFCNSTIALSVFLRQNGYTEESIEESMDKIMTNKEAILNILNGLYNEANCEYSFNDIDKKDIDKKERTKTSIHTTEGVLLDKLELMNNDIMGFLTLANLPERTINYHSLHASNKIITLPLSIFNEYYWKDKVAKVSRRCAKSIIEPLLKDMDNIELVNKQNNLYFKIINNNVKINNVEF